MTKSPNKTLKGRIQALIRRRDFLYRRIKEYSGKDDSRDRHEHAAIDFAVRMIEQNWDLAYEMMSEEIREKEARENG